MDAGVSIATIAQPSMRVRNLTSQDMKRIGELDGLRGIAAGMVVYTHLINAKAIDGWDYLFGLSAAGVDIFFALSGFLIGGILLDHYDDPSLMRVFYARRFLRIVPIYILPRSF